MKSYVKYIFHTLFNVLTLLGLICERDMLGIVF